MSKNIKYLLFVLFIGFQTYSQSCMPLPIELSTQICQESEIAIVDFSVATKLEVKDSSNNSIPVTWLQTDNLWLDISMTIPYSGSLETEVYFKGDNSFEEYYYQAEYNLPGCTQLITSEITIYTDGLIFEKCNSTQSTIADIDVLNFSNSQIDFYSDLGGTTSVSASSSINAGEIYYISFGSSCTLVPLLILEGTPVPEVETIQSFCSQTTWQNAGFTNLGDDLSDVIVCGENLTWYNDAAGNLLISDPSTITLNDNDIFYVSQSINGCESDLVEVNMAETQCGCIENGDIEGTNTAEAISDYEFYTVQITSGLTSCDVNNATYTDPINQFSYTNFPIDDPSAKVSLVTEGSVSPAIPLAKTSPYGCSEYGFRLNDYALDSNGLPTFGSAQTATTLVKNFVAGETLSFDFAMFLNDPSHLAGENPSLLIRLYNVNGDLINSRCILTTNDCHLEDISGSFNSSYTDWSKINFDTSVLQGEKARIEITINDCPYTVHWATVFLDNFNIEDNFTAGNSIFGDASISISNQTGSSYEVCSVLEDSSTSPSCSGSTKTILNPTFPINICGNYNTPQGGTLNSMNLSIRQNGTFVYGTSTPIFSTNPQYDFCFSIDQNNISDNGIFDVEVELDFTVNCGSGPTFEYISTIDKNSFKICPVAYCPSDISACSGNNIIDLTNSDAAILNGNNPSGYSISYYTSENGALNELATNLISDPANFSVTSNTTVFARLDYASPIDDCFDVISFEAVLISSPAVPATVSSFKYCESISNSPQVDLSSAETEIFSGLNTNDYTWDFYENLSDAENEQNAIINPSQYSVVNANQEIFVRVQNSNDSCFSIASFLLEEHELVSYTQNILLSVCDDTPADGFYTFDLDDIDAQINGMLTNNTYQISYYETQADATNQQNELGNNYTNTTQDQQTVYVRITDNNTGCFVIKPVELIIEAGLQVPVNPVPSNSKTNVELTEETVNGNTEYSFTFQWTSASNPTCLNSTQEEYIFMLGITPNNLTLINETVNDNNYTAILEGNSEYYWQVIPKDGNDNLSGNVPIWSFTTETLSINNNVFNDFNYFTKDHSLHLISNSLIYEVRIYDLNGREVIYKKEAQQKASIDITKLQSSIYLAKINIDGNSKVIKFVKK